MAGPGLTLVEASDSPLAERRIGTALIRLAQGDLTTFTADAIVNAANNHLWMGGGVAGAIKRRGGADIEKEAVRKGPIPIGDAVATGAGRLPARYVIHAVTMGQDLTTNAQQIRKATRSALRVADDLHLRSIAFPALGTGVGGFPLDRAATAMVEEIATHLRAGSGLADVVCVLYDEEAHAAFALALQALV